MKRIAIQLFGHLRTFEYASPSLIKKVVDANKADGYEIDFYIHTWNELDHSTVNYRNAEGADLADRALTDSDIQRMVEIYQPVKYAVEPQLVCDEFLITEKIGGFKRSIKGALNMSYSLYRSSELRRESGIPYDWVIVTRPDILFINPLRIDNLLELYKEFSFPIPARALFYANNPFRSNYGVEDPRITAGTDLIYFARPQVVDTATSLYENFDSNIDFEDFYCFEVWWMTFFKKIGIQPLAINYIVGRDWTVLYGNMAHKAEQLMTASKHLKISLLGIPLIKVYKKTDHGKIIFLGIPIASFQHKGDKIKIKLFNLLPIIQIKEK